MVAKAAALQRSTTLANATRHGGEGEGTALRPVSRTKGANKADGGIKKSPKKAAAKKATPKKDAAAAAPAADAAPAAAHAAAAAAAAPPKAKKAAAPKKAKAAPKPKGAPKAKKAAAPKKAKAAPAAKKAPKPKAEGGAKKASTGKKSAPKKAAGNGEHKPHYADLAKEAIVALKDRTGSSQAAIEKYILANRKDVTYLRQHLRAALKRGTDKGELVKVKASYKLPPKVVKTPEQKEKEKARRAANKAKKAAETKKD